VAQRSPLAPLDLDPQPPQLTFFGGRVSGINENHGFSVGDVSEEIDTGCAKVNELNRLRKQVALLEQTHHVWPDTVLYSPDQDSLPAMDATPCERYILSRGHSGPAHSSRYLLLCEAIESTQEEPALLVFERLFRERGLRCAIRTDNSVPFASPNGLFNLFKTFRVGNPPTDHWH
jgi:hypothetical protein